MKMSKIKSDAPDLVLLIIYFITYQIFYSTGIMLFTLADFLDDKFNVSHNNIEYALRGMFRNFFFL